MTCMYTTEAKEKQQQTKSALVRAQKICHRNSTGVELTQCVADLEEALQCMFMVCMFVRLFYANTAMSIALFNDMLHELHTDV